MRHEEDGFELVGWQQDESRAKQPIRLVTSPKRATRRVQAWQATFLSISVLAISVTVSVAILEKWTFLQAMYFITVTMSTVGFGDVVPKSPTTKILTCILSAASLTLLAAAFVRGLPLSAVLLKALAQYMTCLIGVSRFFRSAPLHQARFQQFYQRYVLTRIVRRTNDIQRQYDVQLRLSVSAAMVCALISTASVILHIDDPKTFSPVNAVYFSIVTMTTVGFGDVHPNTETARAFVSLFAVLGPLTLGRLMAAIVELYIESHDILVRPSLPPFLPPIFLCGLWYERTVHGPCCSYSRVTAVGCRTMRRRAPRPSVRPPCERWTRAFGCAPSLSRKASLSP